MPQAIKFEVINDFIYRCRKKVQNFPPKHATLPTKCVFTSNNFSLNASKNGMNNHKLSSSDMKCLGKLGNVYSGKVPCLLVNFDFEVKGKYRDSEVTALSIGTVVQGMNKKSRIYGTSDLICLSIYLSQLYI